MADPRVDKVSIDSLKLLVPQDVYSYRREVVEVGEEKEARGEILTVFTFALLDERFVLDVVVTRLAVEPRSKRDQREN